ncbi:hypothetical protein [Streptomyces sp. CB03238]|nr:hypothetical protein [Streptomyces sp. CB03238]
MITPVWMNEPDVPPHQPVADDRHSLLMADDSNPEFRTYYRLSAARRP